MRAPTALVTTIFLYSLYSKVAMVESSSSVMPFHLLKSTWCSTSLQFAYGQCGPDVSQISGAGETCVSVVRGKTDPMILLFSNCCLYILHLVFSNTGGMFPESGRAMQGLIQLFDYPLPPCGVKGTVQRDFWPPFLSSFKPAWATDQQVKTFSILVLFSPRYSYFSESSQVSYPGESISLGYHTPGSHLTFLDPN